MINYTDQIASERLFLELQVPDGAPIGYNAQAVYFGSDPTKIVLRFFASRLNMHHVEVSLDRGRLAASMETHIEDEHNHFVGEPGLFRMEYDHRAHRAVKITFDEPAIGEDVQFQFPVSGQLTFVVRIRDLKKIIDASYELVPRGF